jgi:chromosome segregation ATPase
MTGGAEDVGDMDHILELEEQIEGWQQASKRLREQAKEKDERLRLMCGEIGLLVKARRRLSEKVKERDERIEALERENDLLRADLVRERELRRAAQRPVGLA